MEGNDPQFLLHDTVTIGTPRQGRLTTSHGSISTPACLIQSRCGVPAYLTADLVESLPSLSGLQVSLQDIWEYSPIFEKYSQGYNNYVHSAVPFFLSCRDPAIFFESSQATMTIRSKSGRAIVNTQDFVKLVNNIKVDLVSAIAYDLPWTQTRKRSKVSVDTTLKWLDEVLAASPQLGGRMMGVIQGGGNLIERIRSAQETAKRNVFGFVLGSFGLDETEEQSQLFIAKLLAELNTQKPILMNSRGDPLSILSHVSQGVDLFNSAFVDNATELGCALTWKIDPILDSQPREHEACVMISLKETRFQVDEAPLVHGCPCFTCQHHTRSYLFHLLNTHEMLAETLLQLHNVHHYLAFFTAIRAHIEDGSYHTFHAHLTRLLTHNP